MEKLRKQMDALMRLVAAEDGATYEEARQELRALMNAKPEAEQSAVNLDVETEVRRILLELGVPDHLIGHAYLVDAIVMVVGDTGRINNVSRAGGLYETVGDLHHTTASRTERAIRHCIEACWRRCDLKTLTRFFGSIADPEKGKTTNSEFIARLANVVRMRMKNAG